MGYYKNILKNYGHETVCLMKKWLSLNKKLASMVNRRVFLLRCRKCHLLPEHLFRNRDTLIQNLMLESTSLKITRTLVELQNITNNKLLNIEISITISKVQILNDSICKIRRELFESVPNYIFNNYEKRMVSGYNKIYKSLKIRMVSKYNNLENKKLNSIKTSSSWIKNISSYQIPPMIMKFLSLGPKFCLEPNLNQIKLRYLIADVENIINTLDDDAKNIARASVTNIITNYINSLNNNKNLSVIQNLYICTKRFLKNNNDIIVTQSDKGNVTVIMNKSDYEAKSEEILNDTDSYSLLGRDPTLSFQQKSNKLVSNLKHKKIISDCEAKDLLFYNSVPPKFYGAPKIHKPSLSLRPVISSINSPNSKLCSFLNGILSISYNTNNPYYVKDSFHFADFIRGFKLPDNHILISLDVVSLFSNISEDLALCAINKNWNRISLHCKLSLNEFTEILTFIFGSNYCLFRNKFYKQKIGCPMGSIISPILAQFVMDDLLDTCIPKLSFNIPFIKKFVDDIVLSVKEENIPELLLTFNSFNSFINFTVEKEFDGKIAFLDMLLIRNNFNIIELSWYQKSISSQRYIHFLSQHTFKQKVNTLLNLKNRVAYISDEKYIHANLKKLTDIFIDNGYSPHFINKFIFSNSNNIRNSNLQRNQINPSNSSNSNSNSNSGSSNLISSSNPFSSSSNNVVIYKSLLYIPKLSDKIKKTLINDDSKITYKNFITIKSLFTKVKDETSLKDLSNVVYKISCKNCNMVYIGQTSRLLKYRLISHKSDCNNINKVNCCALSIHTNQTKHQPDFDSTEVLDRSDNYVKRLFLEMYHINFHDDTLNKKTDTQNLSTHYCNIIKSSFS